MGLRAALLVAFTAFLIASVSSFINIPIPDWIQERLPSAPPFAAPVVEKLDEYGCQDPAYRTRILSKDPLIMHVENFFTSDEADYLIKIGEPLMQESMTSMEGGRQERSKDRTSSSAYLPYEDPVVKCITRRASAFQGFVPLDTIEALQITSYKKGQQYVNHYDWGLPPNIFNGRSTTFFGILKKECDYCGTSFPEVKFPWPEEEKRPCSRVECTSEHLVAKPIEGSAVFWRNLHENGTGDLRTLHAGLPVNDGFKVGLNIWTREWPVWTYDHNGISSHQKQAEAEPAPPVQEGL